MNECNLEKMHINGRDKNISYNEKYPNHTPFRFAYKLICMDDTFRKPVVLYRGKSAIYKLIEAILEEYEHCKQMIK